MEANDLLKARLIRLQEIYKAGLKELDNIFETNDLTASNTPLKKLLFRRDSLIKYDKVFASLISDIFSEKQTL